MVGFTSWVENKDLHEKLKPAPDMPPLWSSLQMLWSCSIRNHWNINYICEQLQAAHLSGVKYIFSGSSRAPDPCTVSGIIWSRGRVPCQHWHCVWQLQVFTVTTMDNWFYSAQYKCQLNHDVVPVVTRNSVSILYPWGLDVVVIFQLHQKWRFSSFVWSRYCKFWNFGCPLVVLVIVGP
jgi:hypothetical protein